VCFKITKAVLAIYLKTRHVSQQFLLDGRKKRYFLSGVGIYHLCLNTMSQPAQQIRIQTQAPLVYHYGCRFALHVSAHVRGSEDNIPTFRCLQVTTANVLHHRQKNYILRNMGRTYCLPIVCHNLTSASKWQSHKHTELSLFSITLMPWFELS